MPRNILLIFTMFIVSCQSKGTWNESGPYWKEVEKKNNYFNQILSDSSGNTRLYKDFDLWNFKPNKEISKYYLGLNFPIIEIQANAESFSTLIVHSDYLNWDTIYISKEKEIPVMQRTVHCCGLYSSTSGIYSTKFLFYPDRIEIFVNDSFKLENNNQHWARGVFSKNNECKFYLEDSAWIFNQRNYLIKNGIRSEYRTQQIFKTKDTADFSWELGMVHEYYDDSNDSTEHLLQQFSDETSSYANELIFPSLKRSISVQSQRLYSEHESYFWLLWDIWLSKGGMLCSCRMN